MTIRLRCVACHRKLKVPDEALGKKVQCPECGARFIGRIEPSPPPVVETTPEQPRTETTPAAAETASDETPLLDALFAEMATSAPLTPEESGIPREVSLPAAPPVAPSPLNLELDEPPVEDESAGVESLEPEVVEEETVIEEAVEEEPPILDAAEVSEAVESAADDLDSVEVVEDAGEEEVLTPTVTEEEEEPAELEAEEAEITEEAEPEEEETKQPKKKKKRGLLCGCLAGVGLVLLLGCGGLGVFGFRYYRGSISDGDWKSFSPPGASCSVLMPGEPMATEERPPSGTRHRYTVEKPWAQSEFWLVYYDLPGPAGPEVLDAKTDEEAKIQSINLGTTAAARRPITLGAYQGRELRFSNLEGKRAAILRLYLATSAGRTRLYGLFAEGPNLDANSGAGAKFFNSFAITTPPTVPGGNPGIQPPPGAPPGQRPPGR
jgi:DNA-directed RNA polymerase subunit RPC12/RpoP